MSYNIVFDEQALLDFTEAYVWYETQQEGLGQRFEKQVDAVVERLKIAADSYSFVSNDYRQMTLPNFPFVIVFRIN